MFQNKVNDIWRNQHFGRCSETMVKLSQVA